MSGQMSMPVVDSWGPLAVPPSEPAAVRVRTFRPLTIDDTVEIAGDWAVGRSGEPVYVRELCQGGRRCVEESWWGPGSVPASLVPALSARAEQVGAVSPEASDAADDTVDPRMAALDRALRKVLAGQRRRVVSVAAVLGEGHFDGECPVVADREAEVVTFALGDPSAPMVRGAVWFGCWL